MPIATEKETKNASLSIVDNRTGEKYSLPILHNAVNAAHFKQIKAPVNAAHYADQDENGLRIFDPGYSNTAVSESKITYMFVFTSDRMFL